jgi:hypothetical protein
VETDLEEVSVVAETYLDEISAVNDLKEALLVAETDLEETSAAKETDLIELVVVVVERKEKAEVLPEFVCPEMEETGVHSWRMARMMMVRHLYDLVHALRTDLVIERGANVKKQQNLRVLSKEKIWIWIHLLRHLPSLTHPKLLLQRIWSVHSQQEVF